MAILLDEFDLHMPKKKKHNPNEGTPRNTSKL